MRAGRLVSSWRIPAGPVSAAAILLAAMLLPGCEASPGTEADVDDAAGPAGVADVAGADPLDPRGPQEDDAADAEDPSLTLAEFNDRWSGLLVRVVDRRTGGVDYQRLGEERESVDELVEALHAPRRFQSDRQRLAFLLNAYNLLVVASVIERPALPATVRDIDGFFDGRRHTVLGDRYTLDELRDNVIRPLGEPRAHFAMTNGAIAGPPLLPAAYTAADLDRQLAYQTARFLGDAVRNASVGPTAMLSPIFRWFSDDFEAAADDGTLAGFLHEHAPAESPIGRLLRREPDPAVSFLQFNWALNHVHVPDLPVAPAESDDPAAPEEIDPSDAP